MIYNLLLNKTNENIQIIPTTNTEYSRPHKCGTTLWDQIHKIVNFGVTHWMFGHKTYKMGNIYTIFSQTIFIK